MVRKHAANNINVNSLFPDVPPDLTDLFYTSCDYREKSQTAPTVDM